MSWSDIKIKSHEATRAELLSNIVKNKYVSPANFSHLQATPGEVQANLTTVRYLSPNNFGDLIATQAEQEAGSSAVRYVSPSVQHHHQSAIKGWVNFDGTGTLAIADSYNVTSVTDDTTGQYTVNWATDFSATGYCVSFAVGQSGARYNGDLASAASQGVGTTKIITSDSAGTIADCDIICVMAIGDQ